MEVRRRAADDFTAIRARMQELRSVHRPRAADDFETIHRRMEELRRERAGRADQRQGAPGGLGPSEGETGGLLSYINLNSEKPGKLDRPEPNQEGRRPEERTNRRLSRFYLEARGLVFQVFGRAQTILPKNRTCRPFRECAAPGGRSPQLFSFLMLRHHMWLFLLWTASFEWAASQLRRLAGLDVLAATARAAASRSWASLARRSARKRLVLSASICRASWFPVPYLG